MKKDFTSYKVLGGPLKIIFHSKALFRTNSAEHISAQCWHNSFEDVNKILNYKQTSELFNEDMVSVSFRIDHCSRKMIFKSGVLVNLN